LGPYPAACKQAWEYVRFDAAYSYGLTILSSPKELGKLGPLAKTPPTDARNIGDAERKKPQQDP
jgi:hypothetical protein